MRFFFFFFFPALHLLQVNTWQLYIPQLGFSPLPDFSPDPVRSENCDPLSRHHPPPLLSSSYRVSASRRRRLLLPLLFLASSLILHTRYLLEISFTRSFSHPPPTPPFSPLASKLESSCNKYGVRQRSPAGGGVGELGRD